MMAEVLLAGWLELPQKPLGPYDFFELFAGRAAVSQRMPATKTP